MTKLKVQMTNQAQMSNDKIWILDLEIYLSFGFCNLEFGIWNI